MNRYLRNVLFVLFLAATYGQAHGAGGPYTGGGPFAGNGAGSNGGSGSGVLGASPSATSPQRSNDTTTGLYSDAAGTVAVAAGGSFAGEFNSLGFTAPVLVGAYNVSQCGYTDKPSWCSGSDIGAWINSAVTALNGATGTIVIDPTQGPYIMTTSAVIPPRITVWGQDSVIDWNTSSGVAFKLNYAPASGPLIDYQIGGIYNLHVYYTSGYTSGNTNIAFYGGGDPAGVISTSTNYGNGIYLHNVDCSGFRACFSYGDNTWSTKLFNVKFRASLAGILDSADSKTNSGENMQVDHSDIFNNTYGLDLNDLSQWSMNGGSCDYNTSGCVATSGTNVFWFTSSGVHFEQTAAPVILATKTTGTTFISSIGNSYSITGGSGTDAGVIESLSGSNDIVSNGDGFFQNHTVTNIVYTNALTTTNLKLLVNHPVDLAGTLPALTDAPYAMSNSTPLGVNGSLALWQNPSSFNTSVGVTSLWAGTGTNDTAVGYLALTANTSGSENTALGVLALNATTSGGYNTALGYDALKSNTTGIQNTAVGVEAQLNDTTASENASLGMLSLAAANAGYNTAVGYNAGTAVTGATNTVVGFSAASSDTSGSYNAVFGSQVGSSGMGTGSYNILIGTSSATTTPTTSTGYYLDIGQAIIVDMHAPTIGSGFGSSPSVPHGTSNAAFSVNVGTGGSANSGVISFTNPAPDGWTCHFDNTTSYSTLTVESVPTSTTSVTLYSYSRTTGTATAFNASDVLVGGCGGY